MHVPDVRGAESVLAWWGRWIRFHDFHLLSAPQPGAGEGEMRIHGWVTHSETDERGYFKTSRDCLVRIALTGIRSVALESAELPAILFDLAIEAMADGWSVTWSSSYGCEGRIEAADVAIRLEPGRPARATDER